MKKNGRLVAIALGSVLCASCVGGAFLVAGTTPAAETVRAASDALSVKYTVSATNSVKASGDVPDGSSAVYHQTFDTVSQVTSGNSATLTLSNLGRIDISKLTLNMRSNTSKGAGSLSYSLNGEESVQLIEGSFKSNWYSNWSTSYVDIVKDVEWNSADTLTITISSTENSLYIKSYTLEYSLPAAFNHITIEGEPNKNTYYVGDTFSTDGLVVNGYLTSEDVNPVDLTNDVEWSVDPAIFEQAGNETNVNVKASYAGLESNEATFAVDVKEPATVTSLVVEGDGDLQYFVGDTFSLDGLTVYANMSDGEKIDVTGEVTFDNHTFTLQDGIDGILSIPLEYKGQTAEVITLVDFEPISDIKKKELDTSATVKGTVTGKFSHSGGYSIFIEDDSAAIFAFAVDESSSESVNVGDVIALTGTLTDYNGLTQLNSASELVVIQTSTDVEPTLVTDISTSALEGWDSRYVIVSGLTYSSGMLYGRVNGKNQRSTLYVNHESGRIGFYSSSNGIAEDVQNGLDTFFEKIEELPFTFTGHVGWFKTTAQLNPTSIDEFSCPDYDAVMAFINTYMKPDVSPSDEGDGKSCLEWYPAAKAALEALTETQRNFFLTSGTTAAYANRYNNWAKAYGEGATSSLGTIMSSNDTAAIIALVALSSATVAAAGFMIASRRRKAK